MKYILTMVAVIGLAFTTHALACYGFYNGNSYVSGMNKVCYYNHLGSTAAITVQSYSICPQTVTFSH